MPSNLTEEAAETAGENKTKTWGSTGITGLVLHVPSGIYYHRYSVKGKRTYRTLQTRRFATAKLRLAKKSEDVQIARLANRSTASDDLRTMGDFERLFRERMESNPTVTESTKLNYRNCLSRVSQVWPEFANTLAARVTPEKLIELRAKLRTARFHKGRTRKWTVGYKPGTVNLTLAMVHMLLDLAREKGVIFGNPFQDQKQILGQIYLENKNKKLSLPSRFDMERIFAELATPRPHPAKWLAAMYHEDALNASEMARFMAFSGMRFQEASATTWEDVQEKRIHARGTKSNNSDRLIPIIPAMANLLDEMRARRIADKLPIRGKILRVGKVLNALKRVCKRLGLPHITQHGLRHYFATICIESGVDVPTVSRWLGHSDGGAIAMRVYGHLRDEHSIAAAQKVTFGVMPAAQANSAAG